MVSEIQRARKLTVSVTENQIRALLLRAFLRPSMETRLYFGLIFPNQFLGSAKTWDSHHR